MAGRKAAGLPQNRFLQPFEEVVALTAVEPAAQRMRGGAVGARRAAEPEIDPAGKQRLQHLKRSATTSGAWLGSITPPEPTRMFLVTAAICPIIRSGAGLATDARL